MNHYAVLIVDDCHLIRKQITFVLRRLNEFKIYEAPNGKVAWTRIVEFNNEIDFIFLDINMPVYNGVEFLQKYRSHEEYSDTPVIIVSGDSDESMVAHLAEYEANDFMVKPFTIKSLETKISNVISRINDPMENIYRSSKRSLKENDPIKALEKIKGLNFSALPKKWEVLRGDISTELGRYDEAERLLGPHVTHDSKYFNALKAYAKLKEKKGEMEKAIELLKRLDFLSPLNLDRKLHLGSMLLTQGRIFEADDLLGEALILTRDNPKTLKTIAAIYEQHGDSKKANEILASKTLLSKKVKKRKKIESLCQQGVSLREQGQLEEAEKHYLTALKQFPDSKELFYNLGTLYAFMRDAEKACLAFSQALDIDKNFKEAQKALELYRET